MNALNEADKSKALRQFDAVLWLHAGFFLRNLAGGFWLGISNARFARVPGDRDTSRYYRRLARICTAFALAADFALLTLGGALKRKERISGRFADVLSHLYLCSCVLKHFENQGARKDDLPLLHWACQYSLHRAQQSLLAVFWLLPSRIPATLLRTLLFPLGKPYSPPQDRLAGQVAQLLLHDNPVRDRLTSGIYINENPEDATGRIESAFKAVLQAAEAAAKIHAAQKQGKLAKTSPASDVEAAVNRRIITRAEADLIVRADQARLAAIRVDDFDPQELTGSAKSQP